MTKVKQISVYMTEEDLRRVQLAGTYTHPAIRGAATLIATVISEWAEKTLKEVKRDQ